MNMHLDFFQRFAPVIKSLTQEELCGSPALLHKLSLAQRGRIQICYTPFEYVNSEAKLVLVGVTPGRQQMLNAVRECHRQLSTGATPAETLQRVKASAAFSGELRTNLVSLLDSIGIQQWLSIPSCSALFGSAAHLVQTASALSNAVFLDGQNYSGRSPKMTRDPLLKQHLLDCFGRDVQRLPNATYVPLGESVSEALELLCAEGLIQRSQVLVGLPHPSPQNIERIQYFTGRKRREHLSAKTNAGKLDGARASLLKVTASL